MLKFFSLLVISFACLSANSIQSRMPLVVSVDWVKTHRGDKNLVIIDVREASAYKNGHIKGAVNMPVMKDFFTPKTLLMPKITYLKNLFSNAGIDANTNVVVYDNGQFCWAARACWVLKVLGHDNASLLRYGYGKYIQENLPISVKPPKTVRREFMLRINNNMIKTKLDVLMAIGKDEILDGRTKDMYEGKTSVAKRYGHIPTAKLFSGSNNYKITQKGNKLKDFDSLKKVYQSLPKDKNIVIYCQDGADAALDDLIMRKLGYKTSVYEGSWIEWGNDYNLPIANPSASKR